MTSRPGPYCGYCLGDVVFNESTIRWEHAEDGERIPVITPGDMVSAAHNRAGTPVNPSDVETEPIDDEGWNDYDANDDDSYRPGIDE